MEKPEGTMHPRAESAPIEPKELEVPQSPSKGFGFGAMPEDEEAKAAIEGLDSMGQLGDPRSDRETIPGTSDEEADPTIVESQEK